VSADHGHAHDHGHGHGHGSRFIQHHYDDAQHQFDSGKLGIWLFLAQEVLFFSALFVAYVLYRYHHPEIYGYAHKYLDVKYGAINTAVLIFSSLTAAWAVRAAQLRQRTLLIGCLALTILCACAFLGIKYIEYSHKYHEQILFGKYFDPCVSSGNSPLLTKKNTCPGHQGSVWWESNTPQTGCYPVIALDQKPNKPGVQASCSVREVQVEPKRRPKQNAQGEPIKNAQGQPELEPELDKYRRPVFAEKSSTPIAKQCPPDVMGGHHDAAAYPCWKISAQPVVCRPGFYYTEQCEGEGCRTAGAPDLEYSGRFATQGDCEQARFDRSKAIKKQDEEAGKQQLPASGSTVSATCTKSDAVGFVVEHGDHEMRGRDLLAVAKCDLPQKPPDAGDVFADVSKKPKLGEKAIAQTSEHPVNEHEQLYLGPPPDNTSMFFTIYFAMTGLHGIHVLVGVIVFVWLLIRAIKGHFTPDYFGPVDFAALYWHIVDLIWIFLFPLLYLIH
jgi:heme/copper-type cytochrome/quinol oxidase subunit 3